MNKKYELTDITMEFKGRTLYRIRALKDFKDVEAGDLGGWVSNENNLSQEGDCWIYNEAKCMDSAMMYTDSKMYDNAEMHDCSQMYGNTRMYDNSALHGYGELYDDAILQGDEEKWM